MRFLSVAFQALDSLTRAGAGVSIVLLVALVFAYTFDVATRYLLGAPVQWPSNIAPGLFCASIFLSMPEVARKQEHIAIDLLPNSVPDAARACFNQALLILGALTCACTAYIGAVEVVKQVLAGTTTQGSIPYPKWWVSIFIPYGLGLTALQFLSAAARVAPVATSKA